MPFYVLKGKRYEFMKVKKWLLGLVTFAAMVVLCAVCTGAQIYGDLEYGALDDGTVQITDCETGAETVVIPDTIDGKSVTSIGFSAFSYCDSLTSITIPDSVTSIGGYAFWNCTSLKSIKIPNSVTSIGGSAFSSCTSLTSITIPDSVTSIGDYAFSGCTSLTSITIPDSVTSIDDYAFYDCSSLTSITIPNSVTSIGGYAFWNCTSLTSITIPDSVTSIGESAFYGCSSLTSITIPNSVTSIDDYAFSGCTSLASITIPSSVTCIGDDAFGGCTSLTNITIPNSVTSIGSGAFRGCTSLTSITIPDSVTEIGWYAFSGCTSLTSVTIPDSVTRIGSMAFEGTALLDKQTTPVKYADSWVVDCESDVENVIIKNSTKGISDYSFYGCSSLIGITIPDGVTSIGEYAFSGCSSLTSIAIPNGVTEIGLGAFSGCTSLTSVTIPNSVTEIGYSAFSGCTRLTSITIPDSVTSIGGGAFYGCSSLTAIDVEVGNNNYTSANGVLFNKGKTSIIRYPAGKADKSYNIPDSVTSIGGGAFIGCSSLTSITIPDSVTEIGGDAFGGCTSLTSITIPVSVTSIGGSAFSGCTSLTSITIPDSVTEIGWYAFSDCTSLTSITIPNSVTWIGSNAFGYYYDNEYKKIDNFKIYCYSGTAGEQYAMNNDFDYVLLDKLPTLAKVGGVKLGGRTADALRINWAKNANADGYIVEMYQGNKWVRVGKITKNSTTTFRKAGLKASTVYKFRVRAYKMSGKTALYGNYSATVTARTNPSVMKGAKLGGRAADALRINWTKNASADGYIVEMYQNGKWTRVAKITSNSTTTFRKAGLKASTAYKFRVRAYKMSGKTALYGNYSATVTARTNPSVMKGVKIGGKAKDALRVNWTKNASAQGYIVEMYKGGKWVRVAKITKNSTNTYRKAGLAKNTTYKFRVKAYYMSGKTALYGNYGSVSGKTAAK